MTPRRDHLVPFGTRGWRVWREVLVRSAGFPADGLRDLAAPGAAAAADAVLAGRPDAAAAFDLAYTGALEAGGRRLAGIAADPLFVEAVTWQNPNALIALDGLVRAVSAGTPRNGKRWAREEAVSRYWQRYCGKNETVGFFGPILWSSLRPDGPAVAARPGAGLVGRRVVFLEYWALRRYAQVLADDPAVRPYLPVRRRPDLALEGRTALLPGGAGIELPAADAALLAACDGRRSATELAADLVAAGTPGARSADDVLVRLEHLAGRGLLRWGVDLPMDLTAEDVLVAATARIPEPAAHRVAAGGVDALRAARDRVAAAAGDPAALGAALAALDDTFAARTGGATRRRDGQMYAGRTLCHEETVRDLAIDFGPQLLDAVTEPLEVLLGAARWLTAALADAYLAALRDLYDDLAAAGPVRLSELWYLAQGMLFGTGPRPVDAVAAEFARRAGALFGLAGAGDRARVELPAAELSARAGALFAAPAPGWRMAAVHSPDLQVCATSVDALNSGDFLVVLGELHAAWPTFDCSVFMPGHDDPERLRTALSADLGGPGRLHPLWPVDWPRHTGRTSHCLTDPGDRHLAFADAPGAGADRTLPTTGLLVSDVDGELTVRAPDGRHWPLIEAFAALVSMHAVDGFKLLSDAPHTPRVTVGRLVVARETWRCTVGDLDPVGVRRGPDLYLAVRRFAARLGLPDAVFVKLGTETKPVFADLTSPVYASSLMAMLRAAYAAGGPEVPVTFSELLPGPEHAWLPDVAGNRYHCELRLQFTDPVPARTAPEGAR